VTAPAIPAPAPGRPRVPGSRAAAAPTATDTTHVPETTGAAPNHPPYLPGDLVVRDCDGRILRVVAVHDLTAPIVDGYICEIPGVRWLVDAEAPGAHRRPYLPSELRTATADDLSRTPRRRQITRRLHHATSREG
jgi:hypothetical protein